METPIKDILKEKYKIDIDKEALHELIAKQVDKELLKRMGSKSRKNLGLSGYFSELQQSITGIKAHLHEKFTRETINKNIHGIKAFLSDYSINPKTISENIKELLGKSKDNVVDAFSKIKTLFKEEQQNLKHRELNNKTLLSEKFSDLQDMMKDSYNTINHAESIKELRNYKQVTRLEIIEQTLALEDNSETENKYNFNNFSKHIDWSNQDNQTQLLELYNYLKDANETIHFSDPYSNDNDGNKLQLEQFTLQGIQKIEEKINSKDLNESRLNHLENNRNTSLNFTENNLKSFDKELKGVHRSLTKESEQAIKESKAIELEQEKEIYEAGKIQESELFQTLNNQYTFAATPEKESSELEKANFVGIEGGEIIVEVDENLYALTLNDKDKEKIQKNTDIFEFTYNTQTGEFKYSENKESSVVKSNSNTMSNNQNPLPKEYIELAEQENYER
ncbi:TPA: hypothetical protein ACK0ZO_002634 [Staphylococcus aureus]